MYVTSAYYRGKSYFVHMYVDKQAILVSKIAPTVMVHTVQKSWYKRNSIFVLFVVSFRDLAIFRFNCLAFPSSESASHITQCATWGKIMGSSLM